MQLKSVVWDDDWVQEDQIIPVEEWSHIAMTWDNTTNDRTMILNGKLVAEMTGAMTIPQVTNNLGIGLWVGWPVTWGDDWFMGIIDDVKVWNRVLTVNEVAVARLVEPGGKLATAWGNVKSAR